MSISISYISIVDRAERQRARAALGRRRPTDDGVPGRHEVEVAGGGGLVSGSVRRSWRWIGLMARRHLSTPLPSAKRLALDNADATGYSPSKPRGWTRALP